MSPTTGERMLPSENHPTPTVFAGLDVSKSLHHLCALTADGKRVFDRKVDNDETELRTVLTQLLQQGPVLLVVDQPAGIGALSLAVARDLGVDVAYLPGLATRTSSPTPPEPCRTPCTGRRSATPHSPSSPCSSATTTTSPTRPPA